MPNELDKFHLKNGDLSAYAFACGYIQVHKINEIETTLYHDGCFHVRTNDFNEHKRIKWESYSSLVEARNEYKEQCKEARAMTSLAKCEVA